MKIVTGFGAGALGLGASLGIALGLAACGDRGGPGSVGVAAGDGAGGEEAPLDDVVPDVSAVAPRLEVLESGAEPRVLLRYQVRDGREEQMRLQLGLEVEVTNGAEVARMAAPPTTLDLFVGPVQTFPDGRTRYRMRASNVSTTYPEGAPPELVTQIDEQLAPLGGISGQVVIDDRGLTQSTSFAVPDDLAPRQRTMLGNIRATLMSIPFPEVPVGVGARWVMKRGLRVGGFVVQQEATYTLTDFADGRGRVQITGRQTAAPQVLGEVEPGVVATLEAYESSGTGSAVFALGRITPHAEYDGTSTLRARVDGPDGSALMQQRMRVVVGLGPLQ